MQDELNKTVVIDQKHVSGTEMQVIEDVKAIKVSIDALKIELGGLCKKQDELRDEMNQQMQASQTSFITVFGIFASIISVLTIEFQFLSKIDNDIRHLVGFTLILFASLFGFNIALDYLAKNLFKKQSQLPMWVFVGFTIGLFILGIVFIYKN